MSVNQNCYEDLFEYGLLNDKLVHVSEVQNGMACNCKCPNCETDLVAYNNPKNKRASHFQHASKTTCNNYFETTLHYLAKEIIAETGTLIIPDINYSLSEYAGAYLSNVYQASNKIIKNKSLVFDEIIIERKTIDVVPDLICIKDGRKLLVEIAVTHFIDDKKRKKIYNNEIPVLEIDLSGYSRTIQKDKLRETLIGDTKNMKWIYNPKIKLRLDLSEEKAVPLKKFVSENTKPLKVYGKEQYVYNCPINNSSAVKVQDECIRCRYYLTEWEALYETGDDKPKYPQITLDCIGHKASDFDNLLKKCGVIWRDK